MPLDTIGLYNKLEAAREESRRTSKHPLKQLGRDKDIFITKGQILPGVKAVFIKENSRAMPLFTLWVDPVDVELIMGVKPKESTAILAGQDDDIQNFNERETKISMDEFEDKSGYPAWKFHLLAGCTEGRLFHFIKHRLSKE